MGQVLGAIISGVYQEDANKRSINVQKVENQLDREYNSAEAEKSRQFIDQQRLAAQEYQSAEWDRQQAYNTPAMQAQRLREGGINPAVYFSGSQVASGSSVSAPSGGSAPAASFNGGLSPTSIQLPSFGDIGQFMKDLSEARKNVADTKTADLMRDPMYRQALSQLVGQELTNKSLDLVNKFNEASLPDRVMNEFYSALNSALQCRLAETDDELKRSEISLNRSVEKLNNQLANNEGTKGLILLNDLASWKTTYDSMMQVRRSEIQKNKSQATEAQASADYTKSLEKTENELRSLKKAYQVHVNSSLSSQNAFGTKTFDARARIEIEKSNLLHNEAIKHAIENKDRAAYTSLQRILLGKTQDGDWSRVWRVLSEISESSLTDSYK